MSEDASSATAKFRPRLESMLAQLEAEREARIACIRNALARMDAGEFGACIECGNDIPERRLDADPSVPLCVACAEAKGG